MDGSIDAALQALQPVDVFGGEQVSLHVLSTQEESPRVHSTQEERSLNALNSIKTI